jgi:hypothetical protein
MKPLSIFSRVVFASIVVAGVALTFSTTAYIPGVPTDTTPIPRPNFPPGGGGDSAPIVVYPRVDFVYDKATPSDAKKAYPAAERRVDWLAFGKEKIGGFFGDRDKEVEYKDKVPTYEFRSVRSVLVADITKRALGEDELVSACESLRDKLESNAVIFRRYLGIRSFTPIDMSDDVIFQIQDDMLSHFLKAVTAGNDYTLISVCHHDDKQSASVFDNANKATNQAGVSLILVDNLDWRNMKILNSMQVTAGSSTAHLLVGKDGTVHGRLDKANPTVDELSEFIKASKSTAQ